MGAHPLVCQHVADRVGAALSTQQRARLEAAIASRIGHRSEEAYLRYLGSFEGAAELAELMSVLSVHRTELYRDARQLETLLAKVFPRLLEKRLTLQVWSAGCATGEEVATLLLLMAEAGAAPESLVLGTDVSAGALHVAKGFSYSAESIKPTPVHLRERYFRAEKGRYELVGRLAARARFAQHNLMDFPYPLPEGGGGFDLILCRNVLIYFTESAAEKVLAGLAERLNPGGVLVLGAAEPLNAPKGLSLWREEHAFFHVKGEPPAGHRVTSISMSLPPVQVAPPPRPSSPPPPPQPPPARFTRPEEEGAELFRSLLASASQGEDGERTEAQLRQVLYLAPALAPARYLLGVLLEQRGQRADAAAEYRRAIKSGREANAPKVEFFLNPARLERACYVALDRLGYPRGE